MDVEEEGRGKKGGRTQLAGDWIVMWAASEALLQELRQCVEAKKSAD